jgi:hypothetical protein
MRCSRFCFVFYLLLPCSFPSQQRREPAASRQATSKRNEKFEGKKKQRKKKSTSTSITSFFFDLPLLPLFSFQRQKNLAPSQSLPESTPLLSTFSTLCP